MKYALCALVVLAFFVACETQPEPETPSLPPVEQEPVAPPITPPEEEVRAPVSDIPDDERTVAQRIFGSDEAPTQAVPAEVNALIERAEERTGNGYSFTYSTRVDGMPGTVVFEGSRISIKDDVMVAELQRVMQLPGTRQDANRLAVTAEGEVAWCTTCNEPAFPADQGLSELPPPMVWLYYIDDIEVQGQQRIDNRNAMLVTGTVRGQPAELWIDEFSGVPLRVTWQGVEYRYERIAFGVSESTVHIP